ncbi:MAG TPA: cupin domain-containing protein [Noviherbaspirillum sp.]|jgi:50S ribosomal protein L16 3-hydroxylase|uniref:cupin domain-containing protein n=1 Tax=Noviherbaspirillum sp. TaxID=1926288 RepID=UPI002F92D333
MKKLALLGGLTPQQFLREYWHKKPLLIRQAIPGFQPLLSREDLLAMARRDDVESRLISRSGKRWQMAKGPLEVMPAIGKKGWTLLVQGVNLHDDAADTLMQSFRFIPDARLDDLMISYATEGGGVGPHFDSYDVFLLQAHGRRRWQISAQKDLSLAEGMPLKILENFQAEQEYVLEPGDMLYLPPHYAHDGVALDECMTYSIGFRAPAYQELAEGFLQFMADSVEVPGRYADPDLAPASRPAEISAAMLDRVSSEINRIRFTRDDIAIFLGEYLSEPKPTVFFDLPARPMRKEKFLQSAASRGVRLARKTRMLYRGKHLFVNGDSFTLQRQDRDALLALADHRVLSAEEVETASADVLDAFYAWYQDGWLVLR